ncbi:gfo/Idh/MocA family oxidoreductase [Halapricum sp. CBA1109]|uniref:Gfo/Idh/MocA family protein n=1 Tax=Halapricum sp. CBA1109 TaxID=2668068 RepID=UPI0012FB334D|nr:Gfo/Idh/MocA family oxidoreductase [Halapricum sp. CBA1109]MUV89287.1 gfo/Idh/MocA family oxidoreductase [Halapricum sp. CBA1109]
MTLSVGVVGAGWMATDYHVPGFDSHPETRVVAFAEASDDRRATVAAELSLPGYPDAAAMLAAHDLDIVSVCTPPSTHEDIFVAAVEDGCHVLCEKPLATDAATARRMADAADEAGVVTQVGYLHRYYGNYQRAMDIVSNTLLGDVVEVTVAHHSTPPTQGWYYDQSVSGGGVVRDLFPHSLDVLLDLFGQPTVESASVQSRGGRAVEDLGRATLSFDGPTATVSASWTQTEGVSRVLVVGTEGWLELSPERLEGDVHGRPFAFEHGDLPMVDIGLADLYPASDEDPHRARIHDFADHAAAGDRATTAPASRGVAVAEIIDAVYEQADAGGNR